MKKVILTSLMSVAAIAAFAQGTVNFDNGTATLSSPPDRMVRFLLATTPGNPYGSNNAIGVGTNFQVQLYYGSSTAAEGSLTPVPVDAPATLRASTSTTLGWRLGGTRTLVGFVAGDTVELQVRVWDIAFGSTYEAAGANGTQGKSAIFLYTIPTGNPAPSAFSMANFTGFTINAVPEPASFAMVGLGAAALLIFRRRK